MRVFSLQEIAFLIPAKNDFSGGRGGGCAGAGIDLCGVVSVIIFL